MQLHSDPSVIDLGVGQPQPALLPLERLGEAAAATFKAGEPDFLQYGAEQGDAYFRELLAKFLTQGYDFPTAAEHLFITNGASMGLDLICTLYTRPGDVIFVEEPTYFLALRIFQDHYLRPIPLPVDGEGLSMQALEQALTQYHPRLLYTIPTCQNPSGATLSPARRARLVQLSRAHNFLIVADEVYHFLQYHDSPPPALPAFAPPEDLVNIVSLGSFSKILAPGLRLGWILTNPARASALAQSGLLASGGGMNPFTSAVVGEMLENGQLAANLAELRSVYAGRIQALEAALQRFMPDSPFLAPTGGYFFWVRLPPGLEAKSLQPLAEKHKVSFRSGALFSTQGEQADYIRLSISYYPSETLVEGVRRLSLALDELRQ